MGFESPVMQMLHELSEIAKANGRKCEITISRRDYEQLSNTEAFKDCTSIDELATDGLFGLPLEIVEDGEIRVRWVDGVDDDQQ